MQIPESRTQTAPNRTVEPDACKSGAPVHRECTVVIGMLYPSLNTSP